jgi:ATP-dependent Clp protease ATP-binding subunit ClpA
MFERFTEGARNTVEFAQDEARALHHSALGTEHLLLGLLRVEEGLAAQTLTSVGIELADVRARVTQILGQGDEPVAAGELPLTSSAERAFEVAEREANSLGHEHIDTGHLLLGLAREDQGGAMRVLHILGTDGRTICNSVLHSLGLTGAHDDHEPRRASLRRALTASLLKPKAPRWEHRVERLASLADVTAEWLDERGDEGWEVAGLAQDGAGVHVVLKRPAARSATRDEHAGEAER